MTNLLYLSCGSSDSLCRPRLVFVIFLLLMTLPTMCSLAQVIQELRRRMTGRCGDIELTAFLEDAVRSRRYGWKNREYRAHYNNRPSHSISLIPSVTTTSGLLHCEFVTILFLQTRRERNQDMYVLLFLQDHRETDHFFTCSVVHLVPLPPHGILLGTQIQDWEHSR